jgi:hypothetical protein
LPIELPFAIIVVSISPKRLIGETHDNLSSIEFLYKLQWLL